jgi:hypothetical protein
VQRNRRRAFGWIVLRVPAHVFSYGHTGRNSSTPAGQVPWTSAGGFGWSLRLIPNCPRPGLVDDLWLPWERPAIRPSSLPPASGEGFVGLALPSALQPVPQSDILPGTAQGHPVKRHEPTAPPSRKRPDQVKRS